MRSGIEIKPEEASLDRGSILGTRTEAVEFEPHKKETSHSYLVHIKDGRWEGTTSERENKRPGEANGTLVDD